MASKEELYISISPNSYRSNKSHLLTSQADLLITLKRLHNLTILARQKHDLKKKLSKLLSSTLSELESLQEKLPTPKLPKSVQKVEEVRKEKKENFSKRNEIDEELKKIQEKLRQLNA